MELKFKETYTAAQQEQVKSFFSRLSEEPVARSANSFGARKVDQTSDGNVYEFIGVSEGIKRDGSTIHVPGIDLRSLKANPVFMFGHQYDRPPIGRIVDFKRTKLKDNTRALAIRVAPLNTQLDTEHTRFANMIFDMIDKGDMRTVSFGWATVEAQPLKDTEGYFTGWNFLKSDGLEFSAVPIPADPSALITTVRSYGFDENILDRFVVRGESNSPYVVRETVETQEWDDDMTIPEIQEVLTRMEELVTKFTGVETKFTNVETAVNDIQTRLLDVEQRKGAVLNGANRKALVDAATLIATVLKNASVQEDTTAPADTTKSAEQIAETREEKEAESFDDIQAWITQRQANQTAREILGQMAQKRATRLASKTKD